MAIKKLAKDQKRIDFRQTVEELSGERIRVCYQCGECSGGCPGSAEMDLQPNQIMHKIQLGDSSILDSKTIWICSACYVCSLRCPKGIDIAKVMDSLRELALRDKDREPYVTLEKLSDEALEELPQIALISSFRKQTS